MLCCRRYECILSFIEPPQKRNDVQGANVCPLGTRCVTLRSVKYFTWDDTKNEKLKAERGIGFEEIVFLIERGDLLEIVEHPKQERYPRQQMFIVKREDYVYLVPFVEEESCFFLKTIIPSRKATREYLRKEAEDDEARR
jgi:uncharacterized DUF497 family protein